MGTLKEKAVLGVKWSTIGNFTTQGVNFIVGLILARILVPSDYGVIGMVGIFFAIAQTFIDSGFTSALIRKKDCSNIDYSTAFYFNIVVAFICSIILSISSSFIASFFGIPLLKDLVKVMSINMFIGSFSIVPSVILSSNMDFRSHAKISFMSSLVSGVVGIAMAHSGFGVWSLIYQNLTLTLLRVIYSYLVTKWRPQLIFSKVVFRYLCGFGSKILMSSLLHTIYKNLTTLIIGKVYTAKDLGFYSRGESLSSFPSTNITNIIQTVTYPLLSKIQDDDECLINSYRKLISITSLVVFFVLSLVAALAKPLVLTLLTDKWLPAVPYVQIFCFTYMFDHICSLNLNLLYVKGYSNLVLRLEIVKKTISIMMIIAAIPLGVIAVCISRALYTQIAVFINTYYSGKLFNMGYTKQLKDYMSYFICSILSVIPAYLISYIEMHSILQLGLGALVSLFLYLIFMRKDVFFIEVIQLLKQYIFKHHS